MFSQDYILRQVQLLVQVLERVLSLRRSERLAEASEEINRTLLEVFKIDCSGILTKTTPELIALCSSSEYFNVDEALALADLLREEGHTQSDLGHDDEAKRFYEQSRVLYKESLKTDGAVLPFDIYDRIKDLS